LPNYIISQEAIEDINSIWIYMAKNWSTEQADRYHNLIMDEIEYISDNFESARELREVRKGYRYSKMKSNLIFEKKTKNKSVEVVRVLHEIKDIESRLSE
jgi:toxin ParE1/3/4